ncbi:anthrone oxygenase family protein [Streptomyces sp. SID14478]|uniref:anthrone oxygenase family protein n=1 Tax=Streptomyces sp. SID14478 TaxID=2706073 RepID=UPI001EF1D1B3|nr:anthrone oxygenase family protein [Streptomyces sp. SID14478]
MTTTKRINGFVLGAATVAMGLIAGAFYVFSCAVMPALARSDDRTYIEVMQNINEVIQNPVFFLSFIGALLLTGFAAWRVRRQRALLVWVLAALVVYVVAFLITSGVNVPMNDALADAGDPARIADPARVRDDFEDPWVAWNAVRAVLCTVSLGCLVRAMVVWGRRA